MMLDFLILLDLILFSSPSPAVLFRHFIELYVSKSYDP